MQRDASKQSFDDGDQLLTVEQVCDILRVSRSKVYAMIRRGELPCVHMGRALRLLSSDIRAFVLIRAREGKKKRK